MMTLPTPNSGSPFEQYAGEYVPGMSDEEELKRIGIDVSNMRSVGDLDDFDREILGDEGFRVE